LLDAIEVEVVLGTNPDGSPTIIEWQVMPRVYQRAGKIARQTDEEKSD
jgi:hypothetical protein